MKATGIVRRVDDLGRIVIPKEIRRTLRIREGDFSRTTVNQSTDFAWRYIVLHKERHACNKAPIVVILVVIKHFRDRR